MHIPWHYIWGAGLVGVGVYWIVKRNVPVRIAGYPSSFYAKGRGALLLGIVAIIIGLILALDLPEQLRIDQCLDRGGRYDYERDVCLDSRGEPSLRRGNSSMEQR